MGVGRGPSLSSSIENPVGLFSALNPEDPIFAAILLKRTGVTIASWVQQDAPSEILTVMAATLIGSLDTIAGTLGVPTPNVVSVETERLRLLATPVDLSSILVLISPHETRETHLRNLAQAIMLKVTSRAQVARTRRHALDARV